MAMTVLQKQIDVRTARLQLRSLQDRDAKRIYSLFANWEVVRWLSAPPWPYALDDACSFIAARKVRNPEFITAAIVLDNALIGVIDAIIKPASTVQRERGCAIGYWIDGRTGAAAT